MQECLVDHSLIWVNTDTILFFCWTGNLHMFNSATLVLLCQWIMKYSLSLLSRQSSSLFILASFFLSVCLSLNETAVLTSLSMNFHVVFWRSRPWVRNSPLRFGVIWIQNFFMGTSSSSSSSVVIYTRRPKTTVTRSWRLDQTNTSSTSGRKFRLWRRSNGHLLASCSRVVVRRQQTHDRQTMCLW